MPLLRYIFFLTGVVVVAGGLHPLLSLGFDAFVSAFASALYLLLLLKPFWPSFRGISSLFILFFNRLSSLFYVLLICFAHPAPPPSQPLSEPAPSPSLPLYVQKTFASRNIYSLKRWAVQWRCTKPPKACFTCETLFWLMQGHHWAQSAHPHSTRLGFK
jgi:hypothetical protein